jgi:hypothetical protein
MKEVVFRHAGTGPDFELVKKFKCRKARKKKEKQKRL